MADLTNKPRLIYDGDCGFCRRWVARWQVTIGEDLIYEPYQQAARRYPDIPVEQFKRAVHLIEPDGTVRRGAAAVFATIGRVPGRGASWWLYRRVPGVRPVSELAYRIVAVNRRPVGWLATLLWGRDLRPARHVHTRAIYLRLLAVIYAIAIGSLWVQIHGLIGSEGILPAGEYLSAAHEEFGAAAYWHLPTLGWISTSDIALHGLCAAGMLLAVLLLFGIASGPVLLGMWAIYLSLAVVGQAFLSFQWDTLLLETVFVSMFWASWRIRRSDTPEPAPPASGRWLVRLLLFKLMFLSGATKLLSGDVAWWDLTALDVHYQTQPLTTWIGWYAHHLPGAWQQACVLVMFVIEIIVPWCVFAPRRVRHLGCVVLILFQLAIAATGNYGFFNLLTIVLCIGLLDDRAFSWLAPKRQKHDDEPAPVAKPAPWTVALRGICAALILLVSALVFFGEMAGTMRGQQLAMGTGAERHPLPQAVVSVLDSVDRRVLNWSQPMVQSSLGPFRTINGYGLFRDMTAERIEIVIEGSNDGRSWQAYEFRWKPGDISRRPGFVAPHMPRLDWQMWFAALDLRGQGYWVDRLMRRLLEGSEDVLELLGDNPFADGPPRYVRLVLWRYEFTDAETQRTTGQWWRRRRMGAMRPIRGVDTVVLESGAAGAYTGSF